VKGEEERKEGGLEGPYIGGVINGDVTGLASRVEITATTTIITVFAG
jgi:hypothetical protein